MRSRKQLLGSLAAISIAAVVVAVLMVSRLSTANRLTPGGSASTALPGGACALSTDSLPVADATRMDAKLVTFDVAAASDPYFPFKGGTLATAARLQGPIRVANYFWVVAAAGTFELNFPGGPVAGNPPSVPYLVEYFPADRCGIHGGVNITGLGAWPTWFDSMPGLVETKIK